ncbi:MAG: hypothetical protein ACYDAL_10985 [Candidatus Dormibacteraceae bacterium]
MLVVSTMLLIPGQEPGGTSVEILSGASPPHAASPVLMAVGGVSLLFEKGGGLYWIVPAMLVAMVAAMVGAWVMLVEIVR